MGNELVVIEKGKELQFFTEGGLEPFLAEVETMVDVFEHDMTTKKGRDATRSFARKIATFKGMVEDSGKELVSGWKTKAKAVDICRKHSRDTLDALKTKARKPLTEWEEVDIERVQAHQYRLATLRSCMIEGEQPSGAYAANLAAAKETPMGEVWEEFAAEAAALKDRVVAFLEIAHTAAQKREDEKAELDRLRKEDVERKEREEKERLEKEQLEREEKAAEDARLLAEEEAKEKRELAEREAKEREERLRIEKEEAEEQTRRVERERIASEERAKLAAEAAEKRRLESIEQTKRDEAARIQRETDAKEAEDRKREANKRHVGKIRKEAKESLMAIGYDTDDAVKIVKAIAAGQVANITINY